MPPQPVLCHDVYGNTFPTPTSSLQWRPAAYGIILSPTSKQVLLLKQFGSKYDLPGGGLNLGEHPQEAVVREVLEETGLAVKCEELLGVESTFFKNTHGDGKALHSLLFYYRCGYLGGELGREGLEEVERGYVDGAEWVDVGNLEGIEVGSTVDFRRVVRKCVGG